MNGLKWIGVLLSLILFWAVWDISHMKTADAKNVNLPIITVTSEAFGGGLPIPPEYTCDGSGIAPTLEISAIPPGSKSLVLIVEDPDAPIGTYIHQLMWNLPPATQVVDLNRPPNGVVRGSNSIKKQGYTPPCPPFGKHRYYFRVYALNTWLGLPAGEKVGVLKKAMDGHIIGQGYLMGTYSRKH